MPELRHILSGFSASTHFRRVTGKVDLQTGEIIEPPSRPHQPGSGISFKGYCPKSNKALEPLKKLLFWAFGQNGGDHCIMSVKTMVRLLAEHHGVIACKRTVQNALKRLVLDGYISRQSRWKRNEDGTIKRQRSKTRPKGRLLNEQLERGMRAVKLLAQGLRFGGEGVVQRFAAGYKTLWENVVPKDISTGA